MHPIHNSTIIINVFLQTLVNGSGEPMGLHVIPPTTSFFKISYSKDKSQIMPGLSITITVQFKPDQWKYYYDCIRIHCKV